MTHAGPDPRWLTAVDVHVHVESDGAGHLSLDDELLAASAAYFRGTHDRTPTVDQIAAYYPLYAALEELGVVALFHTGQTGIGAGLPGGRGIKLRRSDPMLVDDVAADFPGLSIVLAHPSVPWQDEAISIATHKANVWIDLSGWAPKYFPPQLVRAANGPLRHKLLFGTDFPLITPERWLHDFEQLDHKPDVRPLILKENAVRLLGLAREDGPGPDREA